MDFDFIRVLETLEKERGIDRPYLISAMESALESASKRQQGGFEEPSFSIDEETGKIHAFVAKTAVKEVRDPVREISLKEARKIDGSAESGTVCRVEIKPEVLLGRIGAQKAKQVFLQKIHDAEKENLYNEFQDKVGTVVNGAVTRVEKAGVFVDIGKGEAVIPVQERIPGEEFARGQTVKGYIVEVKKTSSPAQIILSRSHPGLVRSLFRIEVPEIEEGSIEIKAIAREPGERCKVAIEALAEGIDPVGTCVGIRGTRIRNIVRELREEKVDIIPWSKDPAVFITNALSPAKVIEVILDEQARSAAVVVNDDQLSLAIGRRGQNVRLAAKITGWKVNMKTRTQIKTEECVMEIREKLGINTNMAWDLVKAGFNSLEGIADADIEELKKIPGIGDKTAEKIVKLAREG